MNPINLKEQHELAIGNQLIEELRYDALFCRHGVDDGEPDLMYTVGGERRLWLEIVTAYYDETQARVEWSLARGNLKPTPGRLTKIWSSRDSNREPYKLIAAEVQRRLNEKCLKAYSRKNMDAVWLCIEQHAPLADVEETKEMLRNLEIPKGHSFDSIYLCHHAHQGDGGGFRVYEVMSQSSQKY